MLSVRQLFVSATPKRHSETPQEWLHASSIKKNKLFTGNCPGQTQEKQRRHHISKEKNETILESEFTPEKKAHLIQSIATTARLYEKGLIHNAARSPKQEFRNVAKEDTPTRNPKQEFRNVARCTAARNPKQELRNVATVLHPKNDEKEMLASIGIKDEVREPNRLTSYDKNVAGARPNVCEAHGKYGGGGAPTLNNERTMTHPKNKFSKAETTKGYGNRDSQYGGNRSRRLDIHRDNKI